MSITVCLASFNCNRFIEFQLTSILSQLKSNDQIVVVDDCSTDNTYDIVLSIASENPQIIVYRNDSNIGVIKSFEKALRFAKHDYVFLSDQDDVWYPNKCEHFINELSKPNVVCVLGNLDVVYEGKSLSYKFFDKSPVSRFTVARQFLKNDFIGCNMAFKREVLERALPFPKQISMHDFWLGVVALTMGKVSYVDSSTMMYRRHSSTVTTTRRRPFYKILKSRIGNFFALVVLLCRALLGTKYVC